MDAYLHARATSAIETICEMAMAILDIECAQKCKCDQECFGFMENVVVRLEKVLNENENEIMSIIEISENDKDALKILERLINDTIFSYGASATLLQRAKDKIKSAIKKIDEYEKDLGNGI